MPCMLRTTKAFTLGMHAMGLLARNHPNKLSVGRIARICAVSEAHLAKVIQSLVRNGIVKGERGPSGGIALSGPPENISMLDIWDVIEGNSQNMGCPFSIHLCKSRNCSLGRVFEEHNRQIEDLMKRTTLKDLECMSEVLVPEGTVNV